MNLVEAMIKKLDTSSYQVPQGMTEKEMMDLMTILYKSVLNSFRVVYWNEFRKYMLYLGLLAAFSFTVSFLMDLLLTKSAIRQVTRIRLYTLKSITKQEISWHEKTGPGELSSKIINDTILIENGIGLKFGIFIQNIVTFIGCFIIAFKASWKLSLSISAIIPIILIIIVCMMIILKNYTKKAQDAYEELGGIAHEAFTQIRTIVSFGTEQNEIDRYTDKLSKTRKYGIIKGHTTGISLGLINGIIVASFSIAFIYGTRLIQDKELLYGDVLNTFMGIMMGSMTLFSIGVDSNIFSDAVVVATSLFDIIEREPQIKLDDGIILDKPFEGCIEFQDVHFNYPSRPDIEILKGVSFKCLPGQTVAIIGASGSGKTTLVQLLERFYNKKSGRILIDGKDIEDYNVKWLRSQISLVSQEPTLFDTSISKNIAINCPNATQEQIEEAAKLANAHDFILKLSNGYETNTGERGLQMSGGQKQRICIARTLIKNPKILLLDEATSALDNKSEKIVQAAIDAASSGRTTLIIAHRLSTIKNADLIIVMEKGSIIESGTHEELMKLEQYYYNLVKSQEIKINKEKDEEEKEEEENKKEKEKEVKNDNESNDDIQKTKYYGEDSEYINGNNTVINHIASSYLSLHKSVSIALNEVFSNDKSYSMEKIF
eukprot:jgi/Orpsp1_1/1184024/evm.model.c7180000087701.2